jgi:hypothetical protein
LQDQRSVVFATLNAKYGWHFWSRNVNSVKFGWARSETENGKGTKANHERSRFHHSFFSVAQTPEAVFNGINNVRAGGQEKLTAKPTNSAPSSHTVTKTFTALNKKSRNSFRARKSFGAC